MQNSLSEWDQDLSSDADEIYRSFYRALQRTEDFGLFFVRCVEGERNKLIERLQQDLLKKKIERLTLELPVEDGNLYKIISQLPNRNEIDVLFISGIEKSLEPYIQPGFGGQGDYYKRDTVPRILGHLNLQRERFRDDFPFAIVFLVPLFALKYFMLRSPDFFDWRSGLFEFPQEKEDVEREFSRLLARRSEAYVNLTYQERMDYLRDIQSLIDEDCISSEIKSVLWQEQGLIWYRDGNFEAMVASFDRALELNPINSLNWFIRGLALAKLGRNEEAIASYDRTLEIKPNSYGVWYIRGLGLGNLGRIEDALVSFNRVLEIEPNTANAVYGKACCYALQADIEAAIAHLQQAIALDPSYREMVKTDSDFDRIRDDQRFQDLLE
ncbi:MAG: tetratricopeptide repeat protein [Timaviella obliquedivisa GSE-PSE-MK23-08B]|jgi:tetratricopeptide (TPR) repeat protein|nr:tetratricopeptide repeat protein [Timaviella obliquedivisa GSE-PSE-MK23-08B]